VDHIVYEVMTAPESQGLVETVSWIRPVPRRVTVHGAEGTENKALRVSRPEGDWE